jgi:hypothetical protein
MVAVVARHAEKRELFSAGECAHPTNERNKVKELGLWYLQRHPARCPPFAIWQVRVTLQSYLATEFDYPGSSCGKPNHGAISPAIVNRIGLRRRADH